MTSFLSCTKRHAWLVLLPFMLFASLANSAFSATAASFSATASGTTDNLSIVIRVNVADADLGKNGNYYVASQYNGKWKYLSNNSWQKNNSGVMPVFYSSPLVSGTATVISNTDLTNKVGAQLFVGYGLSETDMLANNKYAIVYTVTAKSITSGPAPVLLGTSGNYAVLAKTAVSSVPASAITGDVGVSPAATTFLTGFSLTLVGTLSATSPQVTGKLYGGDMTTPTNSNLTVAVQDMQAAYTDAAGRPTPDQLNLGSGNIGGTTLPAGLYNWGSSVIIPTSLTIAGGANDVWIFQISGDLTISPAKNIILAEGAQAKNIFWQVAGEVIIGAGAHFEGNILSQTGITMQTGSSLNGRALAQTMVALEAATVTKPAL